ncbi:MAG: hypothetical protein IGR92_17075, partial [Leptolyngbyaceae cyanobacterium T60_A2020_046]|nr:hypothetical protein [Leptolyngbyaceae cyanobacterium T60_A2020_046]
LRARARKLRLFRAGIGYTPHSPAVEVFLSMLRADAFHVSAWVQDRPISR